MNLEIRACNIGKKILDWIRDKLGHILFVSTTKHKMVMVRVTMQFKCKESTMLQWSNEPFLVNNPSE